MAAAFFILSILSGIALYFGVKHGESVHKMETTLNSDAGAVFQLIKDPKFLFNVDSCIPGVTYNFDVFYTNQ